MHSLVFKNTILVYYKYTITDQSWQKSNIGVLQVYDHKPVLTQIAHRCTTNIRSQTSPGINQTSVYYKVRSQTSPGKNQTSVYYKYTITDQSWHKSNIGVLQVYDHRPVLAQIKHRCTTSIRSQTSPGKNQTSLH